LAGALDALDAIIYFGVRGGVSAGRIFHYIASGLIGIRASIQLGWLGVLLGVILHFTIAIGGATVFYLSAVRFPFLIRRPFLSGTIFGLGLYFFMNRIVIPLSAVPRNPNAAFSWIDLASGFFAHIVLIGIPIALIARRSALVKPPGAQS
jgi:uncharacterized membrane protein YagU involved in acid resistance